MDSKYMSQKFLWIDFVKPADLYHCLYSHKILTGFWIVHEKIIFRPTFPFVNTSLFSTLLHILPKIPGNIQPWNGNVIRRRKNVNQTEVGSKLFRNKTNSNRSGNEFRIELAPIVLFFRLVTVIIGLWDTIWNYDFFPIIRRRAYEPVFC